MFVPSTIGDFFPGMFSSLAHERNPRFGNYFSCYFRLNAEGFCTGDNFVGFGGDECHPLAHIPRAVCISVRYVPYLLAMTHCWRRRKKQ